ncbi:23S rRNA (guanine-N-2-) -methyltransferase rlmG [Klebsiella grimontii]|uniref:23S rRNA (Guanine-N-2-) -methyltransferase rlmG n=1 Tax=Klebsiella grimontii TaxID=2058152 RepID=A0A7H4NWA5_9ENTR|nr:23S rRNA (guanine-N-2-) -methyltransferase rlmG [Klebsiella grimontii]
MSQVELNGELFTLERFPPNAEEEALQAWEAADEYLLQQVNDVDGLTLISMTASARWAVRSRNATRSASTIPTYLSWRPATTCG